IVKIVSSVKTAISYFQQQPTPDLIFSDIQLGDGLSFEIFKQVRISCPIIFCTAYDEHALAAFETNGIHYILKPFDTGKVSEAIEKFKKLKASFKVEEDS
ncbi:MAG TPA: response regulator, partial [Flavipsychrobacter sp.]|nr:response regulator [Flavipsychrobacter sp.]